MRRNAFPNYEINEQIGLGDLNDSNDLNYVTRGSRVHYEGEAQLPLGPFGITNPKQHANELAARLNNQPAFAYAQADFPYIMGFTGGTLVVDVTSNIDRNNIQDIAGNIRQEAKSVGFNSFSSERINFIERAQPGDTVQPPFVAPGFNPDSSQAGTPVDVQNIIDSMNPLNALGGSSSKLLIVGGLALVLVLVMSKK